MNTSTDIKVPNYQTVTTSKTEGFIKVRLIPWHYKHESVDTSIVPWDTGVLDSPPSKQKAVPTMTVSSNTGNDPDKPYTTVIDAIPSWGPVNIPSSWLDPPMSTGEYRVIDGELFKVEPGISPDFQLTEKTGREILEVLKRIEKRLG